MQFGINNISKNFFIFGWIIIGFFNCSQIALAQPLDPSLPGYEEVRPPVRPMLKIIAPQSGSAVLGPQVTLEYIVSGVSLIEPGRKDINIRGEGHLRLVFAREGYPVPTPIPFARKSSMTFEDIPEGNYRITLEIVKNNGASYSPPVEATTKFRVALPSAPAPTLVPSSVPTPVPFRERLRKDIPLTRRQLWLSLGTILIIGPAVYFLMQNGK